MSLKNVQCLLQKTLAKQFTLHGSLCKTDNCWKFSHFFSKYLENVLNITKNIIRFKLKVLSGARDPGVILAMQECIPSYFSTGMQDALIQVGKRSTGSPLPDPKSILYIEPMGSTVSG